MNQLNNYSNFGRHLVVSGTYGVGKSTTSRELSEVTGLTNAVAGGMRDILPVLFPGKKLEECTGKELLLLGMYRYGERRALETPLQVPGFVSDGSALHEWAYGKARSITGANGKESTIKDPYFQYGIDTFGELVMDHAKRNYDDIIHLPIEFPIPTDGHRPVSEEFRQVANTLIREAWDKLGKNVIEVTGSVSERIDSIVRQLGLNVSPTLNGGSILPDGSVFYGKTTDALGDGRSRYFSNGFRNSNHEIHNINLRISGEVGATALVDVSHIDWSKKNNQVCKAHFTSVDAILIGGQMTQMLLFEMDGVKRENAGNLWLRSLSVNPGRKPLEDLVNLPIKLIVKRTKLIGKESSGLWRTADIDVHFGEGSGFVLSAEVAYQLPKKLETQP